MSKWLKYFIYGLVFACWVTPANADPVSILVTIGTYIAANLTWEAVLQFVILTALSAGLNYVAQSLLGPKQPTLSVKGVMQVASDVPRTFLLGRYMTAGSLVYVNTWGTGSDGTPNVNMTMVIALSDLPITGNYELWVNNNKVTYNTGLTLDSQGYRIPEFINDDNHPYMWAKFYDGTQTTADSWLVSQFGSDPLYPYSSSMIGYGVAYLVVTSRLAPSYFTAFPAFKVVADGVKLYDPRLDTTNGGSGSHRYGTPATYAFTMNPMVMLYNLLRGIEYNATDWLCGLQALAAPRLPTSSWFAAQNACDTLVSKNGGGTEAQYRAGAEVPVNVSAIDIANGLLQASNARMAEVGGSYKVMVGAAGSSVMSITDDSLIVTETQQASLTPSLQSLINGMTATWPDPAQGWIAVPAPPRYNSTLETADGGRRLVANVDYALVPYAEQVQRLMLSAINEGRKFRSHTVILPPDGWVLEPNDTLTWTSTRNSYTSKLFLINQVNDLANVNQGITMTEVDPADYTYSTGSQYIAPPTPPVNATPPPAAANTIIGWAVIPKTLVVDNGAKLPAIDIAWTVGTQTDGIIGIQYEVRLASDDSAVLSGQFYDMTRGFVDVSSNLVFDTDYEVRGAYIADTNTVEVTWTAWTAVTTPDEPIDTVQLADDAATNTFSTSSGTLSSGTWPISLTGGKNNGAKVHLDLSGFLVGSRQSGSDDGYLIARVYRTINSAKANANSITPGAEWGMKTTPLAITNLDSTADGYTAINSTTINTGANYLELTKNYGAGGTGLTAVGMQKTSMNLTYTKLHMRLYFSDSHSGSSWTLDCKITFGATVVYQGNIIAFTGSGFKNFTDYVLTLTSPPGGTGTIKIEFSDSIGFINPGFAGGTLTLRLDELIWGQNDSEVAMVAELFIGKTNAGDTLSVPYAVTYLDPTPPTNGTSAYLAYCADLAYIVETTDVHFKSSWNGNFGVAFERNLNLVGNQIKK